MDLQFSRLPICVGDVTLKVAQGHFATSHSHINYLIDVTEQKSSLHEAMAVAQQLMERYLSKTMVDTILCLDGTRMIGACLAQKMTQAGYLSINEGRDIYVPQVEVDGEGRILFRDNTRPMIQDRNVLLMMASVSTGETAQRSMEGIRYYGGRVAGIAAIYSGVQAVDGVPVSALFDCFDLADYQSYPAHDCPLCRRGIPLDAVVNSFGYSKL